ncbi:MAG: hypothetical protein H6Q55_2266 [Deltaproteobacteria bacterium]|jgi:hypothetical protein|nr:hypothetical protein [Deltaproteobacteria bacterium]
MKIKSDEISRQMIREQIQKGLGQKGAKFDEVLQKTIDSAETAAQKTQAARTVTDIQPAAAPIPEEQQGPVLERIEQLLDTLEEYQRSLGSPNIASDALQTIVARMEGHNRDLAVILVGLPDGDNLKELLNRVLVTSVVEVEKFKRGDYS